MRSSSPFSSPCTLDPGTGNEAHNDVFHATIEGQFTFTPDDPRCVSYTAHFATWFGDESILRNGVQHGTFNVNAIGMDRSHLQFHANAQATLNANGVVTVAFDHLSCGSVPWRLAEQLPRPPALRRQRGRWRTDGVPVGSTLKRLGARTRRTGGKPWVTHCPGPPARRKGVATPRGS
jgi:hypothetical protein